MSDKQNKFINSDPLITSKVTDHKNNQNNSQNNNQMISDSQKPIEKFLMSNAHSSSNSAMSETSMKTSYLKSSLRWVVFISGEGSNLQALLDADPKIQIVTVVSSRAEAPGVARAKRLGVPTIIFSKDSSWMDLSNQLKQLMIDRIFLLGFMKVIPEIFITEWKDKILNLHPSLLPNYRGLRAIERSYEDAAALGVTIHWVTPELDAGPILLQREIFSQGQVKEIPFEKVKAVIHQTENEMVVEAVRRIQK